MKTKLRNKVVSFALLCVMLMSALSLPAFAAGTNLVQNPGFESGLTGWTKGAGTNSVIQTVNSDVYAGTNSLYVGGFATDGSTYSVSQAVSITQPGVYEFSAYVNFKAAGTATSVSAAIGSNTCTPVTTVGNQWVKVSKTVTVTQTGSQTVRFSLNGSGFFLLDNVSLVRTGDIPGLLTNEGFENNLIGWNSRGSNCALSTTAQVHSGAKAIYMGYFANEALVNYIDQDYTKATTGTFTFSAYIKTDANLKGIGAALFIDAKDSTGRVLASATSSAVSNTNGAWQKVTVELFAPATTTTVTVKIGGVYCLGSFYVDDAKLEFKA